MLESENDTQSNVTVTEVRNALERVLRSDEFQGTARLSGFLQYIVEEALEGRSDGIKATTIALDVFKRGAEEGASVDSIVRVTAARLRRKLSHYYLTSGRDDPVHIEMISGSYVPRFLKSEHPPDGPQANAFVKFLPGARGNPNLSLRIVVSIAVAAGFLVAVGYMILGAGVFTSQYADKMPANQKLEQSGAISRSKPFIVVLPLTGLEGSAISDRISTGYLDAVTTNLSKLSGLSVMAIRSSITAAKNAIPLEVLRINHGVTHVVRGSLGVQSDRVRISVQLIDTETTEALFAERFEGQTNDLFELEDRLSERIAGALSVTIDDDVSQRIYLRNTSNYQAIDLLRRATVGINPPNERARVESSRSLHKRVIALEPDFPGGYAGLSQVHSYMVLFRHSAQLESDLKKAIELAERAIKLDDGFASGHAMLGLAYALSGKTDLAVKQVRRAVALNPGDPLAHQWLGGVLMFAGKSKEAISPLLEAIRLDPLEPGTPYLNILGMAYYNIQRYDDAIIAFERNILIGGPDAPNMEAYRAATYAALGRDTDARNVISRMDFKPNEISPKHWIQRWTPSQVRAVRAIESLYRLGLKNGDES